MFSRPFTRLVSLKISIGALDSTLTFLPYFLRKRVLFGEFDHLTRSATVGRGLEVVDSMNVKRTFVVSQGRRPREDKKVTGVEKGQVSDGLWCDNYHSKCK